MFVLLLLIMLPYRLLGVAEPLNNVTQFRQAQTATVAKNFHLHGINFFRTELDIFGMGKERYLTLEFPLYEAAVSGVYFLFFVHDLWGRVVSIAAGIVGGWYLYRLVFLLTKRATVSWLSSFFFFTSPINMYYQQDILIEPSVIATLLAGLYYTVRWIKHPSVSSGILGCGLLALGFMQKGMYGPFWTLPLIWQYIADRKPKCGYVSPDKNDVCFAVIIGIPFFLLYLWQSHVNSLNAENGHSYFSTVNPDHLLWNFGNLSDRLSLSQWSLRIHNVMTGVFLKPTLGLLFVGLIFPFNRPFQRFFTLWFLSQLLYVVIFFRIQSHNNYQMILVPVCAYFMGVGFYRVYGWLQAISTRQISAAAGAIFAAFILWKSNANAQWNSAADVAWYERLMTVGRSVPKDTWGIFVNPGHDWNSVYTYLPGLHLKVVSAEDVSAGQMRQWSEEGYSYMILHEFEKYADFLQTVKPGYSLDFLNEQHLIFELGEYRIFQL